MDFLKQKVHLPGPIYRILPGLYVITAIVLWAAVDHLAATALGIALLVLAGNIMFKRLASR